MGALGPHNGYLLATFGIVVRDAFDVGSSLTEKASYRDVDVRLILDDDEYDAYFDGRPGRWALWSLAWTALGEKLTGLPIDFQFQRQTDANNEFPGPRSALFLPERSEGSKDVLSGRGVRGRSIGTADGRP